MTWRWRRDSNPRARKGPSGFRPAPINQTLALHQNWGDRGDLNSHFPGSRPGVLTLDDGRHKNGASGRNRTGTPDRQRLLRPPCPSEFHHKGKVGLPGRSQTRGLPVRSRMLFRLSYGERYGVPGRTRTDNRPPRMRGPHRSASGTNVVRATGLEPVFARWQRAIVAAGSGPRHGGGHGRTQTGDLPLRRRLLSSLSYGAKSCTLSEGMARPAGFEPACVGLEGRCPSAGPRAHIWRRGRDSNPGGRRRPITFPMCAV